MKVSKVGLAFKCVDPISNGNNPIGQYTTTVTNFLETVQYNYGSILYKSVGLTFDQSASYSQIYGPPIAGDVLGLRVATDPVQLKWAINCPALRVETGQVTVVVACLGEMLLCEGYALTLYN